MDHHNLDSPHLPPQLRWLCRSRCRLIREIQPNIWAPAGNRTFRLTPKNNQRPIGCLHILQTRKELRHRKEKHMIMITLVPQNDDGVRMTMNQRQCFPVGPPVDIAILKLQVWKRQNSDSFQQWPKSGSIRRRSRVNFQLGTRQKIVNLSEGLNSQIAVERQTYEGQEASLLSYSITSNTLHSREGQEVLPNSSLIASTTHTKCHPQNPQRYLQTDKTVFDQSESHQQGNWTTAQQTSDQRPL